MPLNDTQIRNLKPQAKPTKHSDSGGLFLFVSPQGSKLWRLAYRFDGKQKLLSFGPYPTVSLADARQKRDAAKKLLAANVDPSAQAKIEKLQRQTATANTFNDLADEFLAKIKKEGRAEATLTKVRWLLDLVRPALGKRPIAEITSAEILAPLRKIEAAGNYESARRARSTIGQVFRYAIATARAENDPTGGLKGALINPVVAHRAALTERKAFGGLIRAVWEYEGAPETLHGLMLMAYLYPRPGELRQAEWPEIDLQNAVWTIPAARAKMRREHKKPLPPQAVAILRTQHGLTGDGKFVFPSIKSRLRPISENTLNGALRRLGFTKSEMTSHGFRASASSILNESGKWSAGAIEAELAHIGADKVRRAYHRAVYWDERVEMAAWWADEIDATRDDAPGVVIMPHAYATLPAGGRCHVAVVDEDIVLSLPRSRAVLVSRLDPANPPKMPSGVRGWSEGGDRQLQAFFDLHGARKMLWEASENGTRVPTLPALRAAGLTPQVAKLAASIEYGRSEGVKAALEIELEKGGDADESRPCFQRHRPRTH
ncbi:tyrosine-type recombinase/integrase [Mycoplana ramosa]|uniref:Tyrosine-type recombinase/integrase n=1 Tax=Mycoplana ramosa TaxID=40837 RepID=A0ABW3Z279_MYCRA